MSYSPSRLVRVAILAGIGSSPLISDLRAQSSVGDGTHPALTYRLTPAVQGPLPECKVNSECNDGDGCTVDECLGGTCFNTSVQGNLCGGTAACNGQPCVGGFCDCVEQPTLCLELQQVPFPPGENCYLPDTEIEMRVEMGASETPICGAQFFLQYDPAVLDFEEFNVGGGIFVFPVAQFVDEVNGLMDFAIGADPFGGPCEGTNGPATVGTFLFRTLATCNSFGARFRPHNPPTRFASSTGQGICPLGFNPPNCALVDPCVTGEMNVSDEIPQYNCPYPNGTVIDLDFGCATLDPLLFDAIAAFDVCDGQIDPGCTITYYPPCGGELLCPLGSCGTTAAGFCDVPVDIPFNDLRDGGIFPMGRVTFDCLASNGCGLNNTCAFEVRKAPLQTLVVEVELSPTIHPGSAADPLVRCIEFGVSECGDIANPLNNAVPADLTFGLPLNIAGHSTKVVQLPPGNWSCLTAEDPLHTLKATCNLTCVDDFMGVDDQGQPIQFPSAFVASFKGSPELNQLCHWLIGGNLNDDSVIDLLDFIVFIMHQGPAPDASTPCGTVGPNADINGDGLVNVIDFSFIAINFILTDKDPCEVICTPPPAASVTPARMSVTVPDLYRMGMGHMAGADLDRDGVVDLTDIALYMNAAVAEDLSGVDGESLSPARTTRP